MNAPTGKLDPEPRRILIRGVNWLGDAVMTTPAIQRLREAYPTANITLLTHEKLADIWRAHPHSRMNLSADEDTIRGDFDDRTVEYAGGRARFWTEDGEYFVDLFREEELHRRYRVTRTVGSRLTQMYIGVLMEGPDEFDLMEEEEKAEDQHGFPDDHAKILKQRYDDAEKAYDLARAVYENAEDELNSSACSLDVVFLRSRNNLEQLSRYETTIERRLRNAMQDLERLQAARKAEAAEVATVIDITDLNQKAS